MDKYIDRREAGIILAKHLKSYAHQADVIILALPRGGVPVAYELARELSLPFEVFVVRKLGVPGHEELAMGATASGGTLLFNEPLMKQLNLDSSSVKAVVEREQKELERRELLYHGNRAYPSLNGKTIILVDDGIATGFTMRAAIAAIRKQKPASLVVAVPVAEYSTCEELAAMVDQLVCPLKPINFYAVGLWYENFPQTSDEEVIYLLKQSI
ncbi:phosphoribosyltransferase [Legionella sp. km535]|uniref:phosphoribosyltransferase n=1 Tax=Legionella sp. km535 TaxID=2498107 RepID=UPI000F8DD46C|nr:phosphoribosyltransferase [Legionella sp. km535]RUR19049.1 phosphoribosyltransferase [Legionella sp. km535]